MKADTIEEKIKHFEKELKIEEEPTGRVYLKGVIQGLKLAMRQAS